MNPKYSLFMFWWCVFAGTVNIVPIALWRTNWAWINVAAVVLIALLAYLYHWDYKRRKHNEKVKAGAIKILDGITEDFVANPYHEDGSIRTLDEVFAPYDREMEKLDRRMSPWQKL